MEKLLTIDDISEVLQIPKGTIYVWTCKKRIPYRKANGCLRFKWSEIEKWMALQTESEPYIKNRKNEERPKRKNGTRKNSAVDNLIAEVKAEVLHELL